MYIVNKKKTLQVTIGLIVTGLLSMVFLYSQINQQQLIYKSMIFTASIIFLLYLGLVLARLQSSSRNLRERLTDLEFRKQALDEHTIVSITDIKGKIIYVNDKFYETSQYTRDELIGKNHSIIKSGQHSESFYSELWKTIGNGEIWRGQICNRA